MTQLSNTIATQVGADTVEIEGRPDGVRTSAEPAGCFHWKERTDPILAAILLIPGLPLIGVLVALIRLTSKGPGIFRQRRVGKHGRPFTMYKLRTMAHNAEAGTGPVWAQSGDPRITGLGRVLRNLHLDELPQLFNVLKGEMSIVGPRPALPHEVAQYTAYEWQRLYVTPGLSCYWQIAPHRNEMSFDEWVALDLKYIQERSFWVDWKIIFLTVRAMLMKYGE